MFKTKLFPLIFLLFVLDSGEYLCASNSFLQNSDSLIVINPFPFPNPTLPKSPSIVPITASYNQQMAIVVLDFAFDLGEIEVEVLNTVTGHSDGFVIATWLLNAIIPISGGPGHYIITFTLPSGRQYRGTFDI